MYKKKFIIMFFLTMTTLVACVQTNTFQADSSNIRIKPVVTVAFHLVEEQSPADLLVKTDLKTGQKVWLQSEPIIDNNDIKKTRLTTVPPFGKPAVHLSLYLSAEKRFAQFTANHVRRYVAILVDGVIVNTVQIKERIAGGGILLSGDFNKEETKRISKGIVTYR